MTISDDAVRQIAHWQALALNANGKLAVALGHLSALREALEGIATEETFVDVEDVQAAIRAVLAEKAQP